MKKTLITLFFAGSIAAFSQNAVKLCGHGEVMEELFRNDPLAKERIEKANAELEKADAEAFKKGYENFRNGLFENSTDGKLNGTQSTQGVVYNIPVVFHILHQNGSEKISPAQVKDAIDILNRDYNKQNADTADVISQFQNLIGDVEFNFVLAAKDPNGN